MLAAHVAAPSTRAACDLPCQATGECTRARACTCIAWICADSCSRHGAVVRRPSELCKRQQAHVHALASVRTFERRGTVPPDPAGSPAPSSIINCANLITLSQLLPLVHVCCAPGMAAAPGSDPSSCLGGGDRGALAAVVITRLKAHADEQDQRLNALEDDRKALSAALANATQARPVRAAALRCCSRHGQPRHRLPRHSGCRNRQGGAQRRAS